MKTILIKIWPQIYVCSKCEEFGVKLNNFHLNNTAEMVASAEFAVPKGFRKMKEISMKLLQYYIQVYPYKLSNYRDIWILPHMIKPVYKSTGEKVTSYKTTIV